MQTKKKTGGYVYDMTDYLKEHPGGIDIVLDVAGTDATAEFEAAGAFLFYIILHWHVLQKNTTIINKNTKGHSTSARNIKENYCIGKIKDKGLFLPMGKNDKPMVLY